MITKEQVSDLRSFSDAVMQRTLDSTRALQDLKIAQTQLENFLYKLEHDEAVPTQWNDLKTMPERTQQVIVWNTGWKKAETATFKDGKFLDHTGIHVNLTNVVSHWQPITTVAPWESK